MQLEEITKLAFLLALIGKRPAIPTGGVVGMGVTLRHGF